MLKPADKGFCLTSHAMSSLWRDSLGSASCSPRIAASPFSRIYHFRVFPGPSKQTSTADRVRLLGEGQALRSTIPGSSQGSGPPEGLERGGSSSLRTQRSWRVIWLQAPLRGGISMGRRHRDIQTLRRVAGLLLHKIK